MGRSTLAAVLILCLFAACGSTERKPAAAEPARDPPAKTFNTANISREQKESVRVDADKFVGQLNKCIRDKNYSEWVKYLEPKYKQWLESKENLDQASMSDRLRQQKIVLQNLLDYFINVVVPSRSSLRVDDIEFVDENTVKAFMVEKGQRLRIYELERKGGSWQVVK